jgi:hypothetical protein
LNLQNVSVIYSSFFFDGFIVLIIGITSQCWYRVEFSPNSFIMHVFYQFDIPKEVPRLLPFDVW